MKRLVAILGLSVGLSASTLEYYQLYKDIHILRMGGANVGLGGSGKAVFYNPAGLSTMKKADGAEVRFINLSLSTNKNAINLGKDGLDLADIDDEDERNLEVIRIVRKHLGENNNFEVSNFTYLAKDVKNFAFSVGVLANVNLNFKTHIGFGSDGIIDAQGLVVGGGVFGLSHNWSPKLSLGVGAKYLKYVSVNENFTIGKLIIHKDDLKNYLKDDVAKSGESIAFDGGLIYKPKKNYQVGFSVLNIGGVGRKGEPTYIPTTYNVGVGYDKDLTYKFLKNIKIGLDYVDMTDEYPKSDMMKKVRTGIDVTMLNNTFLTLKGGVGLYQGYFTAGVDFRMAVVELSFTTYAEEIGGYSGQDEDRRYLLNLTIGW